MTPEILAEPRKVVLEAQTPEEKWFLWEDALKKGGLSTEETLIEENIEYLRWTREEVMKCWGRKGTRMVKEKWIEDNPTTEAEVNRYYDTLELYIPELSSWHSEVHVEVFLKIVEFLQLCVKNGLTSYLDFGAGIGSSGILFHKYGFDITLADISDAMLKYEKWRLARYNVPARFIDLKSESIPAQSVDCVTAIEVLEHVPDPVKAMSKIKDALKIGGYAFVTTPFYFDPERPQHIVHDIAVTRNFEELGLQLLSESKEGLYRIYRRIL